MFLSPFPMVYTFRNLFVLQEYVLMLITSTTETHILWIFYVFFCLVFAMPLCASVYACLVVTCWESADLLALVCGV